MHTCKRCFNVMPEMPEEVTLVNSKYFGCYITGHYAFSETPEQFLEAHSNSNNFFKNLNSIFIFLM